MLWFWITLVSALAWSAVDALSKWISTEVSDFANLWIRFLYATPFLLIVWFFVDIPPLDATFWEALIVLIPLEFLAWSLYLKAIRQSPLSLTIPFLGLTPVFLLIFPWIILGEKVSLTGGLGVLLVGTGIYFLNIRETKHGWLAPLKAIQSEKGSLLMVIVAIIFSISATFGKLAITHSSPLFFAGFYYPVLAIIILPYALFKPQRFQGVFTHPWRSLLIGIFFGLMAITHFYALTITKVAYMVAVKRTSLIFSSLLGFLFFKETDIRNRLPGAAIILLGVILITLS